MESPVVTAIMLTSALFAVLLGVAGLVATSRPTSSSAHRFSFILSNVYRYLNLHPLHLLCFLVGILFLAYLLQSAFIEAVTSSRNPSQNASFVTTVTFLLLFSLFGVALQVASFRFAGQFNATSNLKIPLSDYAPRGGDGHSPLEDGGI
eukprot:TRINITY_DN6429_c0_g1_i3.p1 TRINITY_DN6429_c0_g1~~TRINITY_DN6429_c0_g1_i3.p1  ORF type:complete len:149 (+),score=19.41 TRINITY_DN6429_c0_g1_i3:171-617(+)